MVLTMVVLTLVVCLTIEAIRNRRLASVSAADSRPLPSATEVVERYFHPGHSWALVEGRKPVQVGVDDFATSFLGQLDRIDVLKAGHVVHQGEPLVTLHHGARALTLVAPVSGVIVDVNTRGIHKPECVNESPYDKGWIARISPNRLAVELCNLMRGKVADRWKQGVQVQLANWFSPDVGLVLQDGGRLIDNLGDLLTDEQWEELSEALFPKIQSNQASELMN